MSIMNLNSIIFTSNLPSIDIHGATQDISVILINDFVLDNYKLKNEFILIIHGIGKDILRKCTHKTLKANKLVLDFKLSWNNPGATIVQIKKVIKI